MDLDHFFIPGFLQRQSFCTRQPQKACSQASKQKNMLNLKQTIWAGWQSVVNMKQLLFTLNIYIYIYIYIVWEILSLQAHSKTEEYFERSCLPAQLDSDFFKFKHEAFYGAIKSKSGLAFAKAAAMCVIMHIDKSPAIVMGRPTRSSQQHVPSTGLLSSALHHNHHLSSHPPQGP